MLSYQDYSKSIIRKYKRFESLIQIAANSWTAFENNKPKDSAQIVLKGHGPTVFSLLIANGTDFNRLPPNPNTPNFLCSKFLEIDESISDKEFQDLEARSLLSLCHSNTSNPFHILSLGDCRMAITHAFISRAVRAQWQSTSVNLNDCLQNWKIFSLLTNRIISKFNFSSALNARLGQSPEDFFRSAFCIFTICMYQKQNQFILNLDQFISDSELTHQYGINSDTLKICASRICTETNSYLKWFEEVKEIHPYYAKTSLPPIYNYPLIKTKDLNSKNGLVESENSYIYPFPKLIFYSLNKIFYRALKEIKQLGENKLDIDVEFGFAIEDYFDFIISKYQILDIKKLVTSNHYKTADYIYEDSSSAILFELKKSIGNLTSRNILDPEAIFSTWERLFAPLNQLSNSTPKNTHKTIFHTIVVDEIIGSDVNNFIYLLYKHDLLKKYNIHRLLIMTFESFEKFIFLKNKSPSITNLTEKFDDFIKNPDPNNVVYFTDNLLESDEVTRHYDDLFGEIFPNLDRKKV